jgi:tRNA modification GTPase
MLYDDTIVAIATPPGEGGIGIVRFSGPQSLEMLERIFVPSRRGAWRPYQMRHGRVVDNGDTVDEALAVYMRAPRSFTAEDVVEISCHGGPLVVSRVLKLGLARGARLAEPGEFTMRAFVNGRIDLTQAEATLDVIRAKTDANLVLAQAQLGGWLSSELRRVRELLLGPLAYATALVDFPEDEVEAQEIDEPLRDAQVALERLLSSAAQGIIYRQGARVALVGRPNAGKSSLLNALLRIERAIVTPIPGTTRDTLEETANFGGVPVVLVDTAGITETEDLVEQIGVERSRSALATADLVLLVLDSTQPFGDAEAEIAVLTEGKPVILVLNKRDLVDAAAWEREGMGMQASSLPISPHAAVAVSAKTGEGLEELVGAVTDVLLGGAHLNDGRLVTNPRHRDALERALGHVNDTRASFGRGTPPDLLAVDLTAALSALGEITGESLGDDLLAAIFSRFCIGK